MCEGSGGANDQRSDDFCLAVADYCPWLLNVTAFDRKRLTPACSARRVPALGSTEGSRRSPALRRFSGSTHKAVLLAALNNGSSVSVETVWKSDLLLSTRQKGQP